MSNIRDMSVDIYVNDGRRLLRWQTTDE